MADRINVARLRAEFDRVGGAVWASELFALLDVVEAARALEGDNLPRYVSATHSEWCLGVDCGCDETYGLIDALRDSLARFDFGETP